MTCEAIPVKCPECMGPKDAIGYPRTLEWCCNRHQCGTCRRRWSYATEKDVADCATENRRAAAGLKSAIWAAAKKCAENSP